MDTIITFLRDSWPVFAGLCASLACAAFFAAAETAIVFSNKTHVRQLAEAGDAGAAAVFSLMQGRELFQAALLLLENFFIILSVILGAVIAGGLAAASYAAAGVAALLMTFVVVFFAKLAPKSIACKNPDRFALAVAPFVRPLVTFLSPVSRLLIGSAGLIAGQGRAGAACAALVTEEDIKALINLGEERGSLKEEEKELLHKVFEFGDTLASEAMRPRTEIVSVPTNVTLGEVLALVSEYGYSRYPVIEETIDTVTGILYIKDLLVAMASGDIPREDGIRKFVRPAYFIPENKRVSELLSEMQRDRFHIAIVIDEYGGTAGLVTMGDLIEEIVGSIHDELGSEEKDVQIVDEKNFVVSGQSTLYEVNELLDTSLLSNEFNTLGGFVFGLFGRMPKVGEQLKYKSLRLEVLELDGRKIAKIKITKL